MEPAWLDGEHHILADRWELAPARLDVEDGGIAHRDPKQDMVAREAASDDGAADRARGIRAQA